MAQTNRPSKPPYFRRLMRRHAIFAGLMCFSPALVAIGARAFGQVIEPWMLSLWLVWIPICVLVLVASERWVLARIRREFEATGGRACVSCAYNLSTLGDGGTCPECGQAFDAPRDAEAWALAGFHPPGAHGWAPIPGYYLDRTGFIGVIAGALMVPIFIASALGTLAIIGAAELSPWFALAMLMPPLAWHTGITAWAHARVRRTWRTAEGRLCTRCGQDLRGLGDAGLCPECGKPFDIARDAAAWARAGFSPHRVAEFRRPPRG